ncbi:3-oxo-5-alpha-steroid 4-dehydrogenase 1 [Gossypium australe]|uniref:3-oxo-5-alpha-steroid 4-dehydrogenase 1 n=1 Tax=Gossypium australe TaxID=47621 RepID=A0A5B6W481_9ROSI|nr:3-oxo-5-alpha-steroid 4-dehydrogenase 1 [Gossypium australe]
MKWRPELLSLNIPLIPLPRSIYGNLPYWFKAVFLFEFPIYNRYLNRNRVLINLMALPTLLEHDITELLCGLYFYSECD